MDNASAGDRLWAVFLEATKDDKRTQWLLVPPAISQFGVTTDGRMAPEGTARFIKRRLEHKGHRAKWKTTEKNNSADLEEKLKLELEQYDTTGWVVRQPVVIRLEVDDYMKMWAIGEAETPYKALRAVERVTKLRGYRLID